MSKQKGTELPVDVAAFADEKSGAVTYLVVDVGTRECAVIDCVLGLDAAGAIDPSPLQPVIDRVRDQGLKTRWILETHLHADHLSGATKLKQAIGGRKGIGAHVVDVQRLLASEFDLPPGFRADGSQFDLLLKHDDLLPLGASSIRVLSTPGHTPACVSYLIEDCVFVGDTLFMPDSGTARCDFPGGDAHELYRSIHRLFELPPQCRVFAAHDYGPSHGRPLRWESSVKQQRADNIHVRDGVSEEQFVQLRQQRDRTLSPPALYRQAVRFNLCGGQVRPG